MCLLGASGQTLLRSFLAGFAPENEKSRECVSRTNALPSLLFGERDNRGACRVTKRQVNGFICRRRLRIGVSCTIMAPTPGAHHCFHFRQQIVAVR